MRLEKNRVDMAFKMIQRNERFTKFESQNFAVGHTNEQRADQSGSLRHANGVDIGEGKPSLRERFANNRNNLTKMLARGQLGHDTAVLAMNVHLRGNYARQNFASISNDGGGGFVARGFDSEDARGHGLIPCFPTILCYPFEGVASSSPDSRSMT